MSRLYENLPPDERFARIAAILAEGALRLIKKESNLRLVGRLEKEETHHDHQQKAVVK